MVEVRVQEPSSTTSSTSSSNSRAQSGVPNTGVQLGPRQTPGHQDPQGVIEGGSGATAKPIQSKERIFTRENSVTSSPGTQHTAVMFIIAALNKILGDK